MSGTLSKALGRMVQYARADALRPKVLFIEEPFADLDLHQQRMVERWLKGFVKYQQGGILISSSSPKHVRFLSPKMISLSGTDGNMKTIIT